MKLSERLRVISEYVSESAYVADIGTDHGYIPIYLLQNKKIQRAVAADINKGPLENAQKEFRANKLLDKVDLRLGSGLSVVNVNEVEEAIIAGMGGVLISEILETSKEVAKNLNKIILQPMQAQDELRKYLYENGYEIIDETLVKEEFRIYEIIVVKYTGNIKSVDDINYEVGLKLIENKDPLLNEFIDKKIREYEKITEKIEKNKENEKVYQRYKFCIEKIRVLKELKKSVD